MRLDLLVESLALALLKAKRPGREREMQKSSLHPDPTLQGALRLDVGAWAEPVVLLLAWGKPRTSPDISCPQSLFNSKYWRRANI